MGMGVTQHVGTEADYMWERWSDYMSERRSTCDKQKKKSVKNKEFNGKQIGDRTKNQTENESATNEKPNRKQIGDQ